MTEEWTVREMLGLVAIVVIVLCVLTALAEWAARADGRDPWRAQPSRYQAHPITLTRIGFVGILVILALVIAGVIGQYLRRILP